MPLISAIVPVYNSAIYLDSSLKPMLNQTVRDFDLILVDDGSMDKSSDICDEVALKDERLVVCHKMNKGPSDARNNGLRIADGKYVVFWDSDDQVREDFLGSMVSRMKNDSSMALCGFNYCMENSKAAHLFSDVERVENGDFYRLSDAWLYNMLWNKMFNRKIISFHSIQFNPEINLGEDVVFISNYLRLAEGDIEIVHDVLYDYINRNESITHIEGKADSKSIEKQYEAIKNYLIAKKNYDSSKLYLSNQFSTFYIQKLWEYIYKDQLDSAMEILSDPIFNSVMVYVNTDYVNPFLKKILLSQSVFLVKVYFNLIVKRKYKK